MDDAIAQVVAVTGSTTELAAQYVQLADGDANQAVQLFFENGGADLAATTTTAQSQPPPPSTSRVSGTGNAQDPIEVDDDNLSDENNPHSTSFPKSSQGETSRFTATNVEDDEAMARRLQEEMYGGGEESIRAPIARQTETLLGPGSDAGPLSGADLDAAVQARISAMQRRRGAGFRPGIFNQHQPTSNIWQHEGVDIEQETLAESTGGASEGSARSGMLARLFQPPWELMYKGSWDDARQEGRDEKKWILVSIQDGSVFDCQALNRDLWKNEGVVDTVKENFIFLQYSKDDPRAESYIQFYFPGHDNSDMYPHVAIVDPRTGEQIKLWSRKVPQAPEFLMQLHEFLDRYSLENNVRNPVAKRKSVAKKEKSVDQMTEEEMMERALQESMATQSASSLRPPLVEDPDDLTRSIGDLRSAPVPEQDPKGDAMSIYENGNQTSEGTAFSRIPTDRPHIEPAQGPGITRVQIRHPGGRVVRRFAQDDPVQRIYEFLRAEPLDGKAGVDFELVSMGKNLLESRQETIEAAGLKNGTVMVEFVDG